MMVATKPRLDMRVELDATSPHQGRPECCAERNGRERTRPPDQGSTGVEGPSHPFARSRQCWNTCAVQDGRSRQQHERQNHADETGNQ